MNPQPPTPNPEPREQVMEFVGGQTLVGHIRDNLYDAVGAATAQAFFDGFRYRLRGKGGGGDR